jgi:hypothetical protein
VNQDKAFKDWMDKELAMFSERFREECRRLAGPKEGWIEFRDSPEKDQRIEQLERDKADLLADFGSIVSDYEFYQKTPVGNRDFAYYESAVNAISKHTPTID